MLRMSKTYLETLSTERRAMVEKAMFPVVDAMLRVDDSQNREGVSDGTINNVVHRLYPDEDFGPGIIPTAVDALVADRALLSVETPLSPTENNQTIGRDDWVTIGYHLAGPLTVTQLTKSPREEARIQSTLKPISVLV